jgi:hypothetical protein
LRKPPFMGLDFLGFPWILSSESSLINWLHAIFAELKFARPLAPAVAATVDATSAKFS